MPILREEVDSDDSTPSGSVTFVYSTQEATYGTNANTYDGDDSTYYGCKASGGYDDFSNKVTMVSQHLFDTTRDIYKIIVKAEIDCYGYYREGRFGNGFTIQVLQDEVWEDVYTDYSTSDSYAWNEELDYSSTTGWECDGIRVNVVASAGPSSAEEESSGATVKVHEIQAFYESPKIWVRVSGSWKKVDAMWARVSGAWKVVDAVSPRDSGAWK